MTKRRWLLAMLAFSAVRAAETAPWQDGLVISVEASSGYTDVAVAVANTLFVCRPFDNSALAAFTLGLNGKKRQYVAVNSRDVRAGATARVAVFSNGTATLKSEAGRQYSCDVISQRYYAAPAASSPPPSEQRTASKEAVAEPTRQASDEPRPTLQLSPKSTTSSSLTNRDVLQMKDAGLGDEVLLEKIKNTPADFQLEPSDLIALKKAGLSDAVIAAMIRASQK